jgi:F0F1-type ATP synthase membrane subunit c/vacuolar-type H+-ATPase subunit K
LAILEKMAEADPHSRRSRSRRTPSAAQLQRDAALARLSRVRRGVIVAAAGLTAGIAALVSALAPGRSLGAPLSSSTTVSGAGAQTAGRAMPPLATPSEPGLQSPGERPQAAPTNPQARAPVPDPSAAPAAGSGASGGVVSGGS